MILGIYKVSGHSMMPNLRPGERVLVSSIPFFFSKPKIGDIVVFKNNDKFMIKRIVGISKSKVHVQGDNRYDSLKIGWIEKQNIIGKVLR